MKNSAGQLQTISQFRGVAQIPVMSNRHFTFLMIYLYWLAVVSVCSSGRPVPDMTDC